MNIERELLRLARDLISVRPPGNIIPEIPKVTLKVITEEGRWKTVGRVNAEARDVLKFVKRKGYDGVWVFSGYRKNYYTVKELRGMSGRRVMLGSTSGFMGDYRSSTYDNPFDRSMRVWSYADQDGEALPLIMTEIYNRKWEGEDVIWLSAIISPDKQGKGMASHVLKKITKMADKHDVKIWLSPKPFGTTPNALSASQLKGWYKRNGWEAVGGGLMVREPQ